MDGRTLDGGFRHRNLEDEDYVTLLESLTLREKDIIRDGLLEYEIFH